MVLLFLSESYDHDMILNLAKAWMTRTTRGLRLVRFISAVECIRLMHNTFSRLPLGRGALSPSLNSLLPIYIAKQV
jgi:hypothetical protein